MTTFPNDVETVLSELRAVRAQAQQQLSGNAYFTTASRLDELADGLREADAADEVTEQFLRAIVFEMDGIRARHGLRLTPQTPGVESGVDEQAVAQAAGSETHGEEPPSGNSFYMNATNSALAAGEVAREAGMSIQAFAQSVAEKAGETAQDFAATVSGRATEVASAAVGNAREAGMSVSEFAQSVAQKTGETAQSYAQTVSSKRRRRRSRLRRLRARPPRARRVGRSRLRRPARRRRATRRRWSSRRRRPRIRLKRRGA